MLQWHGHECSRNCSWVPVAALDDLPAGRVARGLAPSASPRRRRVAASLSICFTQPCSQASVCRRCIALPVVARSARRARHEMIACAKHASRDAQPTRGRDCVAAACQSRGGATRSARGRSPSLMMLLRTLPSPAEGLPRSNAGSVAPTTDVMKLPISRACWPSP